MSSSSPAKKKARAAPRARAPPPPDRQQRFEASRGPRDKSFPDAHDNELRPSKKYDRNPSEVLDLSDDGASWQGQPRPPAFRRGHQFGRRDQGVPVDVDGQPWTPFDPAPADCTHTYRELSERWAQAQSSEFLADLRRRCVWDYAPGDPPPPWWRISRHDDDTYEVLNLCFVDNYRCYQPGLAQDFTEFLVKALKAPENLRGATGAWKRLLAVDHRLRELARLDKPARGRTCPICDIPFAQLGARDIHFDHKALTRIARGDMCRPCNLGVVAHWDSFGPSHAEASLEDVTLAAGIRGVCLVMPLRS